MSKQKLNQASVIKYDRKLREKQNRKTNLQKDKEEIKLDLKYIPEKYPEPFII